MIELIFTPTKFVDMQTGKVTIGIRCDLGGAIVAQDNWDFMPEDELEIFTKALLHQDCYLRDVFLDALLDEEGSIVVKGKRIGWHKLNPIFELWERIIKIQKEEGFSFLEIRSVADLVRAAQTKPPGPPLSDIEKFREGWENIFGCRE